VSATEATDPVDELLQSVRRGEEPSASQTAAVLSMVRLWLSRRGLTADELDDVATEAVLRLLRTEKKGRLDPTRSAGGWLRVVADHLTIDKKRRRQRAGPPGVPFDEAVHGGAGDDDRLASLLDETAAASDVRSALRAAADAGETTVVRVVTAWLGLAEANGEPPTSRELADRIGISHATVQRSLRTFGTRLTP
jgi:DNA-directed RNA polymerase specialized sigma24 family protein